MLITSDYTRFLDANGLDGARVGVLRLLSERDDDLADSPVKAVFENAIADLRRLGATIVDPLPVPQFHELLDGVWAVPAPFAHDVNAYFTSLGSLAPYKTIQEIFNAGLCDPRIKQQAEELYGCNDPKSLIHPAERGFLDVFSDPRRRAFRNAFVTAMDEHRVDVLIYPTWNDPPTKIGETRPPNAGNNSGLVAPPTGLPALTVPMGYTGPEESWPAGLQMLGRMFAEATLIRLAYAYEQGTRHRKLPTGFAGDAQPVIKPLTVAGGDVTGDRGCF